MHKWLMGADGDADDEEETQDPKQVTTPILPTEEEIRDHEVAHMPFRAWCPSCVQGSAVDDPHLRSKL